MQYVWSKHSVVYIPYNLLHVAVNMAITKLLTRIKMETYLQFYATVISKIHIYVLQSLNEAW
jgi:hypothetical protein